MRGTLCARRTENIFIGESTSQDSSTYRPRQHVAVLGFLAIRRFEGYTRTVLDRASGTQERGLTYALPAFCDAEGLGLE